MCQRYAGRAITGKIKTTSVKAISAKADLPTVATQLSMVDLQQSNPRQQMSAST